MNHNAPHTASDYQPNPIEFTPNALMQFENALAKARCDGIAEIQFQSNQVNVEYGEILAYAVRLKFIKELGSEYCKRVLGDFPPSMQDLDHQVIEEFFPQFSLPILNRR